MRMKLKLLRVEKGMSQEELAALLGVSRQQYREIENGRAEGKPWFWKRVQQVFNLTDAKAWEAMTNTVDREESGK